MFEKKAVMNIIVINNLDCYRSYVHLTSAFYVLIFMLKLRLYYQVIARLCSEAYLFVRIGSVTDCHFKFKSFSFKQAFDVKGIKCVVYLGAHLFQVFV